MKTRLVQRAWPLLVSAIAVGFAAQPASAAGLPSHGFGSPFALIQKPPVPVRPLLHRHRARVKPMTTYTIDDIVTIPSTIEGSSVVAFNNTGQMLGQGYARNTWSCLIY